MSVIGTSRVKFINSFLVYFVIIFVLIFCKQKIIPWSLLKTKVRPTKGPSQHIKLFDRFSDELFYELNLVIIAAGFSFVPQYLHKDAITFSRILMILFCTNNLNYWLTARIQDKEINESIQQKNSSIAISSRNKL